MERNKQSTRLRPGKPYEKGDAVTNRIVDFIVKDSEYLDRIHYEVIFNGCGHRGTVAHKTLTRTEIRGKDGICKECVRIAREQKIKPKKERTPTWPAHPDREIHHWAHCLLTSTIREIAA